MISHRIIALSVVMGALLGAHFPACAEEITLKDGQKIVGTIVGYENDMFRVETEYGMALVRKDKVASIQVTKPDDSKVTTEAPKSESGKGEPRNNAEAKTARPQPEVAAHAVASNAADANLNRRLTGSSSDSP